jgi:hypothetical protein
MKYSEQDLVDLNELKKKIASGEATLSSPFEGMDKPWSQEDKDKLAECLSTVFNWKKIQIKTI